MTPRRTQYYPYRSDDLIWLQAIVNVTEIGLNDWLQRDGETEAAYGARIEALWGSISKEDKIKIAVDYLEQLAVQQHVVEEMKL